jgi:hypothetical protein
MHVVDGKDMADSDTTTTKRTAKTTRMKERQ